MKLKQRLSLQQKILVMVIGASIIIYAIAIGYISVKSRTTALNQAITVTDTYAEKYASDIKFLLEEDLVSVRTLTQTVLTYNTMPEKQWKELFAKMYEKIINDNPQFLSIWDSWELNRIDPSYKKDYGRYVFEIWRENGKLQQKASLRDLTGDATDYGRIKRDKVECIENPYFYSYGETNGKQQLMTSIIVPILVNGDFVGVTGVDISLSRYHPIINQIKPFKGSYAFLIANDLHYVAHPNFDKIGTNATDEYEALFNHYSIPDKVLNGEPVSFIDNDVNGIKSYFTFKPIIIGKTTRPWSLAVIVPKAVILQEANHNFLISIIVGIIGLLVLSSVIFFSTQSFIVTPIQSITKTLKRLANGYIEEDMILEYNQKDEIGQMASALNTSIEGLTQKATFAHNIGQGNLNTDLILLSDEDLLGKSLIHMRESLKTAQQEETIRRAEDEKRQWGNVGLAKFGDILRQNNEKLDVLSSEIIKNLVKYIEANQGGLFIYNDDEPENLHFELLSAYAYNRFKYIKKQILLGEGLIGTCALEKKTIYLTEIPENYIQITSGLGEARPRCLLIVPLLLEEKVLGILELASFNEIEQYKIDFVEKLAQSVASTLTSVRTSIKTSALLAKSQQQTEEMLAQEEEVRQNLEEMETIKEELEKRNTEITENQKTLEWEKSLLDSILNYLPEKIYFKDIDSKFIKGSQSMLSFFGTNRQEDIQGKSDFDFFDVEHAKPAYNDEQRIIKTNTPIINLIEKEVLADGTITWVNTSKFPLRNSKGEIVGTFGITKDISELKNKEEELIKQNKGLQELKESLSHEKMLLSTLLDNIPDFIYFKDTDCKFIRISQSMVALFHGKKPEDLVGKSDFDFHSKEHSQKTYKEEKEIMQGQKKMVNEIIHEKFDDGREQWVSTTKMPLLSESGEVAGLWGISKIVTDLKLAEIQANNRAEEAEKLRKEIAGQQEKMGEKSHEMENYINAMNNSAFVIEYDSKGYITHVNKHYLDLLKVSRESLVGTHHSENMEFTKEQKQNYQNFWEELLNGNVQRVINKISIKNIPYSFEETYSPMKDKGGKVYKIIKIANNISNL